MDIRDFTIEIRRLKRARRLTLRVLPLQRLRLSVPFGLHQADVFNFIKKNEDWILKQHTFLEQRPTKTGIEFKSGELLVFGGRTLQLDVGTAARVNQVQMLGDILRVRAKYPKKAVLKWYHEQALTKINERVAYYSEKLQVHPTSISLKNYKSRWGACSSKGALIFNWQIICFRPELFDYVVAHELCHLKEMNHSPKFYSFLTDLGFDKRSIHREIRQLKNFF